MGGLLGGWFVRQAVALLIDWVCVRFTWLADLFIKKSNLRTIYHSCFRSTQL